MTARRGQAAVAVALLGLAAYAGVAAARMPAGTVALPGPGFFPGLLAVGLGVTALALLVRLPPTTAGDAPVALGSGHVPTTVAALAGVALLFERLGFLAVMAGFLFVLFRALSPLGWWRSAVAAAATTAVAYLFFQRLLGVALPG